MKVDALRGHLDSLVMAVLDQDALHGYAIITALRTRSGGTLDVPSGTIYPSLRRLERAGYVSSTWGTVSGRRRRTYSLTNAGREALAAERAEWVTFTSVVTGVLGTN